VSNYDYALVGKAVRMARLSRCGDGRSLIVPLDHAVSDGPFATAGEFRSLAATVVNNGADALVLHKGRVSAVPAEVFRRAALIVHLSAGTSHAADCNAKVLVGSVEDALRAGADAVSVHVNVGSDTEARQLTDLGAVASACMSWDLPLLAMIYPRGPRIADPHDPVLLRHMVNIAADLGADLVKTLPTRHPEDMATVVESSPIPVLVAGGSADGTAEEFAETAAMLVKAGCSGLAVGRRIFGAADPGAAVRRLAEAIH
jgi:2-amino-4,5-dihydroxy-6-oxo-7-(phosphooxy)heptanoate synthase